MLAGQDGSDLAHGVNIERAGLPYEMSSLWYYKMRIGPEGVGIALAHGVEAGMEAGRGGRGLQNRHIAGDKRIQGPLPGQSGALRRHVGVGHLFQGVDPRVGAGRAVGPDRDLGQGCQGLFQATLDRAGRTVSGLELPALEIRALVGQGYFEPKSARVAFHVLAAIRLCGPRKQRGQGATT